ncbi:MAG: alpha/beta hydrolase [Lachnospiraceae bacterium]|nr:alpha/beta hydrolase [Lachnospiraceae bacterium]
MIDEIYDEKSRCRNTILFLTAARMQRGMHMRANRYSKTLTAILLTLTIALQTGCSSDETLPADTLRKEETMEQQYQAVTADTTVSEVEAIPAFGDYGRLLFPVDRPVEGSMTLDDLSANGIYVWYNNIRTEKTVEIINYLKEQAEGGKQVFYNIYTEEERKSDPSKQDTGLFFFRGEPGAEFAVTNAGGGMMYVGAMHDSFPHALEVSRQGYNAFALIYRPDHAYEDLAQAIEFIYDNADELEVSPDGYSLWGGSAGARMAATLGNSDHLQQLTGRTDIPQAAAVIMQYTGHSDVSEKDAPTYACVGTSDGIAGWRTMERRLQTLEGYGIPTEFHSYEGLPHGFGLGTGTVAEGWLDDAVAFWENQMEE